MSSHCYSANNNKNRRPDPRRDVIFGGPRGYSHQVYGPIRDQRALRGLLKDHFEVYQAIPDDHTNAWAKRMLVCLNILAPIVENGGCLYRFFRRRHGGEFRVGVELVDLEEPDERKVVFDKLGRALNHAWYQKTLIVSRTPSLMFRRGGGGSKKLSTTIMIATTDATANSNISLEVSVKDFLEKVIHPRMPETIFYWLCQDVQMTHGIQIPDLVIQKLALQRQQQKGCTTSGTNNYDPVELVKILSDISLTLSFTFIKERLDLLLYS